jgi:aryl-alcohol dehydrogenase-like predicted oxidoreductase
MEYKRVGTSGLMVSPICLGGNSWGAQGRRAWGAFGEAESRPFFAAALDAGVNFFDTADTYNAGESERIMGATLMKMARREDLVISSKIGIPLSDRPNHGGAGRKHLMAGIDACLKRLGTDYIDIFHIHRLDGVTPIEETLEAFTDMVRMGKIRYFGGSTMPVWRFAQICTLAKAAGYARPITMQNLYNLVQREEELEMAPLCLEYGVGFTPYSPLARGLLSGTRARGGGGETERARTDALVARNPPRDSDFATVDKVVALAADKGVSPSQIALAWMLHKPFMAAPVIGATRPEQVVDAMKAADVTLTPEEMAHLEAGYAYRPAA